VQWASVDRFGGFQGVLGMSEGCGPRPGGAEVSERGEEGMF